MPLPAHTHTRVAHHTPLFRVLRSTYPISRTRKDEDGRALGVMGSVELLNSRILAPQPIVGWDWSPDKEGLAAAVALDQTVRVYIVTKLNKL